jgi:hypothetical protein
MITTLFLVPEADRLTVRQHFLYFVPSYSMLFPNFIFDEGLYDELIEPQFHPILSATFQENNRRPTFRIILVHWNPVKYGLAKTVGN